MGWERICESVMRSRAVHMLPRRAALKRTRLRANRVGSHLSTASSFDDIPPGEATSAPPPEAPLVMLL